MPSLPKPAPKPKARRGGRPPKVPKPGRDKAVVCSFIVDRLGRGQEACGQVLSNPKQANTHLARKHGLSGKQKTAELSAMPKACPLELVEGVHSGRRHHSWKLIPGEQSFHSWCLACGAVEESTAEESQTWVDDMDADFQDAMESFGPCAMGNCRCELAFVDPATLRLPLDDQVLDALRVAANPELVGDAECERWTAQQLLLDEAQRRGLTISGEHATVLCMTDEHGNWAPAPIEADMSWRGVHSLLRHMLDFELFRDEDHERVYDTIHVLALCRALDMQWHLPECLRTIWTRVDAAELGIELPPLESLDDETDEGTP